MPVKKIESLKDIEKLSAQLQTEQKRRLQEYYRK